MCCERVSIDSSADTIFRAAVNWQLMLFSQWHAGHPSYRTDQTKLKNTNNYLLYLSFEYQKYVCMHFDYLRPTTRTSHFTYYQCSEYAIIHVLSMLHPRSGYIIDVQNQIAASLSLNNRSDCYDAFISRAGKTFCLVEIGPDTDNINIWGICQF